jgi:SagB-type dehydrogenase family enzyme
MKEHAGDVFYQETKYHRGKLPDGFPDWSKLPDTYKRYRNAPVIPLDPPQKRGGAPLWEVIAGRRSVRNYTGSPVTRQELAQLLWACQGITAQSERYAFRSAPSAGALYPVETYLAVNRVDGIDPGLYHYEVEPHALAQLTSGDYRKAVAQAAMDQSPVERADLVAIWSAVFERSKWKYKQRGYRYIFLDAGHIAGNLALAAVALGLGSCQIGSLYDDEANRLLGLDGETESVIYMTAVGRIGM